MRMSSTMSRGSLEPATPTRASSGLHQTAVAGQPGPFLVPSFGGTSAAIVAEAGR